MAVVAIFVDIADAVVGSVVGFTPAMENVCPIEINADGVGVVGRELGAGKLDDLG